jgi:hypothetical protein
MGLWKLKPLSADNFVLTIRISNVFQSFQDTGGVCPCSSVWNPSNLSARTSAEGGPCCSVAWRARKKGSSPQDLTSWDSHTAQLPFQLPKQHMCWDHCGMECVLRGRGRAGSPLLLHPTKVPGWVSYLHSGGKCLCPVQRCLSNAPSPCPPPPLTQCQVLEVSWGIQRLLWLCWECLPHTGNNCPSHGRTTLPVPHPNILQHRLLPLLHGGGGSFPSLNRRIICYSVPS